MDGVTTVSIIDTDDQRRTTYRLMLSGGRYHVEPYAGLGEFWLRPRLDTIVLMPDEGVQLSRLLQTMRNDNNWVPTIGFGKPLGPVRCSQLFLMGMIGYLPEPFDRDSLYGLLAGADEQITAFIDLHNGVTNARQRLERLSKREREVLSGVQAGLTNRDIGKSLGISSRTVEAHRASMLRKLNVDSTLAAMRMSVHAQLKL